MSSSQVVSDTSGHELLIVVVGFNSRSWLASCFKSLEASSLEPKLIFIDNASTDGSVELMQRCFPAVEIFRNRKNVGFASASNMGLRRAVALGIPYVGLVNPDTQTLPQTLLRIVEFLKTHRAYGIVGPIQVRYGYLHESPIEKHLKPRSAIKGIAASPFRF